MSEKTVSKPAGDRPGVPSGQQAVTKPVQPALKRAADFVAGIPGRGTWWVSVVAVLGVMGLVVTDVLMRTFLNQPIRGTIELVQQGMVIIAAFAMSYTQYKKRFVRIDIIADKWPKWVMVHLDRFDYFFASLLWIAICWQTILNGLQKTRLGQTTMALHLSLTPFYFVVAFGAAFLAAVLIANGIQTFYKSEEVKKR